MRTPQAQKGPLKLEMRGQRLALIAPRAHASGPEGAIETRRQGLDLLVVDGGAHASGPEGAIETPEQRIIVVKQVSRAHASGPEGAIETRQLQREPLFRFLVRTPQAQKGPLKLHALFLS